MSAVSIPPIGTSPGSPPRVAIVVVNYQTPDETLTCVASLRTLRNVPFEVIVVDNHSADDSLHQFRQGLRGSAEGEHLLPLGDNGGYTGGNNRGIEFALARGAEFVLLLNPDTKVINSDFVSTLVRYLDDHPRVGAVGPRVMLRQYGNIQNTIGRFPWLGRRLAAALGGVGRQSTRSANTHAATAVEVINGVCVLIRAACLREAGLLDERMFAYVEEAEWAWRAERHGWERHHVPVLSIIHHQKEHGYDRGGFVDFLLKRNGVYFLRKAGHHAQAWGYALAALTLGIGVTLRRCGTPAGTVARAWLGRLLLSYVAMLVGRLDAAMRSPVTPAPLSPKGKEIHP